MRRWELLVGLALALGLRLGFGAHSYDGKQLFGDMGFVYLANNLLDRHVFAAKEEPTAEREPGYPLLIAASWSVARSPWSVLVVQSALSAATAYFVFLLASSVFAPRVGRLAFWLTCGYPYFIYYTAYYFRDTFQTFLMSACLALLVRTTTATGALGAGTFAGALAVTNGAFDPVIALTGAAAAFIPRWDWRRGAAFAAPVAAFVGLWAARNVAVMGSFIITTNYVGTQLYQAFAVPYEDLGTPEQTRILGRIGDDTEYQRISLLPEVEQGKAFRQAAWRIARERPGKFLWGCVSRFFGIWRPAPRNREYTHSYALVLILALFSDGWMLPFALAGAVLEWKRRWVRWMTGMAALVSLTFCVSQAPIRYRLTVMPIVLTLTAAGVIRAKDRLLERS